MIHILGVLCNKFIEKDINIPIRGEYRLGSTTSVISDIFGVFNWKNKHNYFSSLSNQQLFPYPERFDVNVFGSWYAVLVS